MSRVLTNATVVTVDAGNRVLEHCDVRVSGTDILNLVQPGDEAGTAPAQLSFQVLSMCIRMPRRDCPRVG